MTCGLTRRHVQLLDLLDRPKWHGPVRNETLAKTRVVRQVDGGGENGVENESLMVSEPAGDRFFLVVRGIGENPSARLAWCMLHFEECRDVYDIASRMSSDTSRIEEECHPSRCAEHNWPWL